LIQIADESRTMSASRAYREGLSAHYFLVQVSRSRS